jgi:acyl-coenzyme A thioesterase PaaI-like protein
MMLERKEATHLERLPSSRGCFICGQENPIGLRVQFYKTESGVTTQVRPGLPFQGFDGVLQGGVVAGLMDDAMWYAIFGATQMMTMTVEMTVRYRAPIPAEALLTINGRLVAQRRSLYTTEATITGPDGAILAQATGKFMPAPPKVVEELLAGLR